MATTTAQAFREFRARVRLTRRQQAIVKKRWDTGHAYLEGIFTTSTNMPLRRTVLIGSAGRDTMIRPPDDVDVMAVFEPGRVWETYKADSRVFLSRVRNALSNHTRVELVGTRGQAVRLFYSASPIVDVAPVFPRRGGGYLLPDGIGGWLATDPGVHRQWSADRDTALGAQMKSMTRMLKAWNRAHSTRLKGFHIEVMVGSLFSSMGNNSRSNSRVFFENASRWLHVNDPAGHGGDLAGYLSPIQQIAVLQSFDTAAERARTASLAAATGKHREAVRLWGVIYGDDFPAYG